MTDEILDKARRLKQQIVLIREAKIIVDDPATAVSIVLRNKSGYGLNTAQSSSIDWRNIEENLLRDVRMLLNTTLILAESEYKKL